jgi:hypothetical protein
MTFKHLSSLLPSAQSQENKCVPCKAGAYSSVKVRQTPNPSFKRTRLRRSA